MKNKILILLLLAMPSLCFSKSLSFIIEYGGKYSEKLYLRYLDSDGKEAEIMFKCNKHYINLQANERACKETLNLLEKIFPKKFAEKVIDRNWKLNSTTKEASVFDLEYLIRDCAILNNFSYTFGKYREIEEQDWSKTELYFYKPIR